MESDFFEVYEAQDGLNLAMEHNSVADWGIEIGERSDGGYKRVILITCVADRKALFAKAYVELTEWLSENRGGY